MRFLNGASKAAKGVKVWVQSKYGLKMTVEYLAVVPSDYVSMYMVEGPQFFHKFSGKWSFISIDNGCKVVFRYKYNLKAFAQILSPFVRYVMNRDMKNRLKHLKVAAEQTDIIDRLPVPAYYAGNNFKS